MPLPQPDPCLTSSRKSRYKGGTIIAEDVWSLEEHRRRLAAPDAYRPPECLACGFGTLHVHDRPERKGLGLVMVAVLVVLRFICANPECRATWRVLPAFLARHLWWAWSPIEQATAMPEPAPAIDHRPVPDRTRRRWLGKLMCSARQLVVLLASRGTARVRAAAEHAGLDANRRELAAAYGVAAGVWAGSVFACVAAIADRLERGVRLM